MYVPFGIFSTWKRRGLLAIARVGALLLEALYNLTASILFAHSGKLRNSAGEQSPNQRQYLDFLLINS